MIRTHQKDGVWGGHADTWIPVIYRLHKEDEAYVRGKIAQREKTEGKKFDYHAVTQELWAFSNDRLV